MCSKPKILLIDIETSPTKAFVWSLWKPTIGINQISTDWYILSFAYKWLGDSKVHSVDSRRYPEDDARLCAALHLVLDEADFVVAHNLKKFDLPKINSRLIFHGMEPYSPVKLVDTLEIAKKKFAFTSNKLEFLANHLGCTPKSSHASFSGFALWSECMKGNDAAWDEMVDYNIQDVLVLEEVYEKLKPWAGHLHPSLAPFTDSERDTCPTCGSHHIQYRGYARTNQSTFARFKCNDCGAWSRSTKREGRTRAILPL